MGRLSDDAQPAGTGTYQPIDSRSNAGTTWTAGQVVTSASGALVYRVDVTHTGAFDTSKATQLGGTSVALNDRGAWATATAYVVGDEVSYNYSRYIAKTAHTSGSAFDPTKFVKTGSLSGRCVVVPDGWGTYWKAARATAGTALVPVLLDGDSLTDGQSASTLANSWGGLLTTAVQALYGDGGSGFVGVARQVERGGWVFSTGQWAQAFNASYSAGPGGNDGASSVVNGATATVTGRGTTVEVYFRTQGSAGSGQATVSIDGGSAVTVNENRADGTTLNKITRYRVTGLSAGTHTVTVTNVGTAGIKLHGARFTNATGVVIDNHGASGHRAGSASITTAGPPDPRPWHGGYELPAQLAVWAYGVNDVNNLFGTVTTVQQYNLAMTLWAESIMEATNGQADLIFVAPHVGQWETLSNFSGSYTADTYAALIAQMKATAERFGAVFIDLWGLGENSWNWMNDRGYWSDGSAAGGASAGTDAVHLSNAGHAWWYSYVGPIVLDQATPETVTPPAAYKPTARLTQTATSGTNPKTVVFDASTSYAAFPKTIATYRFDPGDGSSPVTQAGSQFSYTYTSTGTFTPTLRVTDSAGTQANVNGTAITVSTAYAFQDTFTDTDNVTLAAHNVNQGTNWTVSGIGGSSTWAMKIVGNQLAVTPGAGNAVRAVATRGHHDTVLTFVVGTDNYIKVNPLFVDDSNLVTIQGNQLSKTVAGTTTQVTFYGGSFAAGDTIVCTISGTSITVTKNGSTIVNAASVADAVFTSCTQHSLDSAFYGSSTYKVLDSIQAS